MELFFQSCFLIRSDNGMLRGDIKRNEVTASSGKEDDIPFYPEAVIEMKKKEINEPEEVIKRIKGFSINHCVWASEKRRGTQYKAYCS